MKPLTLWITPVRRGVALGVLAAATLGAPATATPTDTGCPTGYDARTVVEWEALDEPVAAVIDDAGNQDGTVCGHLMSDGFVFGFLNTANDFFPDGDVYLFQDNDSPAAR